MKKSAIADGCWQAGAALVFISALILVRASVETGMNDDWSFVRTTQELALTGRLQYNAWSAPLIGFQALWGALFVKLFGFTFFAVRCSSYTLTLLSIPVMWRVFRYSGLSGRQAFFGLLLFLLSPLNLPNLATFMTDIPAFLLFALALMAALKVWLAENDGPAMGWMAILTIAGFLSGSVRQIYWLAPICFLVTLATVRLSSTRLRIFAGLCILLTAGAGGAASHWLGRQPYVPADTTVADLLHFSWRQELAPTANYMARYWLGAAVLLTPFTLLTLPRAIRRFRLWLQFLLIAGALATTQFLAQPLPWLGNTLSQDGVILRHTVSAGEKPLVLSAAAILLVGAFGLAVSLYALANVHRFALNSPPGRLAILTLPFLFAYICVLAIRSVKFGLYDRYLIPAVFILGAIALADYARANLRIPKPSWAAGAVLALYALATTHDYFAEARAKLQATSRVMAAGHSRKEILGGFEFDCWTQSELVGHINNYLVTTPASAYRDLDDCNGADDVQIWWRTLTPDVKANYVISLSPLTSLTSSEFEPVEYIRWLPPMKSRVYTQRVPPSAAPLTCAASTEN